MRCVVTGGAGFIGRWVVKRLLDDGHQVVVLDDLTNGSETNLDGLVCDRLHVVTGKIEFEDDVIEAFEDGCDLCVHMAARVVVQDSIDNPSDTCGPDTLGTLNVLEAARAAGARFLFVSSCMVYDMAAASGGINEEHPTKALSPYAASKLAGEALTTSYVHTYGMKAAVVRPFNTYGPYQKTTGEGGVVAIFCKADQEGRPLTIYGDGTQTRDLLYVEDCADFIVQAALNDRCVGKILNAGSGVDVSVNRLAEMIGSDPEQVHHVEHIHPQCEIAKLLCDSSQTQRLLQWTPRVGLEEGIQRTKEWIAHPVVCG